jgi:hypothetical protein
MIPEVDRGRERSRLSVRYCWLLVLILTPFLAGGVVVGDEALLLRWVHGLDQSSLSFADYARSPDGWYIPHHILWFGFLYLSAHIAALFHASPLLAEAMISCETVAAALAGIALCYTYLVRRQSRSPARAAWSVLAFFAGGYGVFTFCMGGMAESYMVLAMAARLFFADRDIEEAGARKLAIFDGILIALKAYSLIFVVLAWPLWGATHQVRLAYLKSFAVLMLMLIAVKIWLWNPGPLYYAGLTSLNPQVVVLRFVQQFVSPWTGLLFCLPVLAMLLWSQKARRASLLVKGFALCGCAGFFSLYEFFNGDVAGGRYIFPFVIVLLPDIAAAASRLLDRMPRIAFLLPAAIFAFLPVAALGFPFFSTGVVSSQGPCHPEHPVIYSWKLALAKINQSPDVEICFHEEKYTLSARDVASPRLGLWRVAYILEGGHSPEYRAATHDPAQLQHDAWGNRLVDRLRNAGLGSPDVWKALGLAPALLALWFSMLAAFRINRGPAAPAR